MRECLKSPSEQVAGAVWDIQLDGRVLGRVGRIASPTVFQTFMRKSMRGLSSPQETTVYQSHEARRSAVSGEFALPAVCVVRRQSNLSSSDCVHDASDGGECLLSAVIASGARDLTISLRICGCKY